MIDPTCAFFPDVGVRQAVGLIAERVFESDEAVAALAQNVEQFADVVGFEIARVQQQNLLRFVAYNLLESCSAYAMTAS